PRGSTGSARGPLVTESTAGISSAPGGARRVVPGVSATTPPAPPADSVPTDHPGEASGAQVTAVGVVAVVLERARMLRVHRGTGHSRRLELRDGTGAQVQGRRPPGGARPGLGQQCSGLLPQCGGHLVAGAADRRADARLQLLRTGP